MGFISMLSSWCVLRCRKIQCKWRILLLVTFLVCGVLFLVAQIRPPCLWSYLVFKQYQQLSPSDNNDVLVVTGYLNLGNFQGIQKTFSFYKYLVWAEVFQYILNPLVVYTDSDQIENLFRETRKHLLNRTKVIRVQRSQLHAFQDVERMRELFHSPTYPKYWPNTVIPEYPCSQHAKYEFVENAIEKNYFPWTKYVAWIDIGYFRYITSRHRNFWIVAPPGMDDSKVAVTRVHNQNMDNSPVNIHLENIVWVGGGMSLATRPVFRKFIEEYQHATDTFLGEGLSNTDQQVIYSMFTNNYQSSHEIKTRLQTYRWIDWMFNDVMDCWFYLGYLCYREEGQ